MNTLFIDYLFTKRILVNTNENQNTNEDTRFEAMVALGHLFGIKIVSGTELVSKEMIEDASRNLGVDVPKPFYRGFPKSVRKLTKQRLLFDQMLHYLKTYGLGDFSETDHSRFEEDYERVAFAEDVKIKEFKVVGEKEAYALLGEYVGNMLAGTRPLNDVQFSVVLAYVNEVNAEVEKIASKNTCVKLLLNTRDYRLAKFLNLSDVVKLVDELNFEVYKNTNIKKLNLKNVDRKFITNVIDEIIANGNCDIVNCYEKKKIFNGLLHHIHYVSKTEDAKEFVDCMRNAGNNSVYSRFEKMMDEGDIKSAVDVLKNGKGSGAILRNLNYIISRCQNKEDAVYTLENLDSRNGLVLLQLLFKYVNKSVDELNMRRVFKFTKFNLMKVHKETENEYAKRKSFIDEENARIIVSYIEKLLKEKFENKLGKVYIDSNMKNYALPISEATSNLGFGVLTRGSRISIGNSKVVRAFTYWEKVHDIDLSVIGFDENGNATEFSWRTMWNNQSDAITYSGDETSGYNGGSEYFDININAMKKLYPNMRYMVFCDNVFSNKNFSKCFCKAGFMQRDEVNSGEIYEPKTVESSFLIDCDSRFAYLFGIDLLTRELIWLNMSRSSQSAVVGANDNTFILEAFRITDVMNMDKFFRMLAAEVVYNIEDADVIVTDNDKIKVLNEDTVMDKKSIYVDSSKTIIREYDHEKMIALMNE